MTELQYPIGPFTVVPEATPAQIAEWIDEIASLPARMRDAVEALPPGGLDRPYRPGGWTGRQVVHHTADSHINSYVRFRLALTEDNPTIKPYEEQLWAELFDARTADPEVSLKLLEVLHERWVLLLRSLTPEQLRRSFLHPESGTRDLVTTIQLYAWHGKHHTSHLALIR
jgi:hypothetical protein